MSTDLKPNGVKQRIKAFDYLNFISAFAVILLHVSTGVFLNEGNLQWRLDVVFQSIFAFAVPIFFMISGANLLGYRRRYSTGTFLVKRVRRVFITLIGCSAIIYLLSCLVPEAIGQPQRFFGVRDFLKLFLTNRICDVYWFFYSILVLYAVTPIFSLLIERKRLFEYCLVLSGFSTFIVPLLNRYADTENLFSLLQVSYVTGFIFYYMLGYYLVHMDVELVCKISSKPYRLVLIALCCILLMIVLSLRTNILYTQGSGLSYDNYFHSTTGPIIPIYSVCIFLLAMRVLNKSGMRLLDMGAKKMSALCLGIYAVHMPIINFLDVYVPHSIRWDLFIRPLVVLTISVVIVAACHAVFLLLHTIWGHFCCKSRGR